MKNLLTLLFLLIFFNKAFSEIIDPPKLGFYFWNTTVEMEEINFATENSIRKAYSELNQKFKIIKILNDNDALIQILNYNSDHRLFQEYNFNGTIAACEALSNTERKANNHFTKQKYFKVKIALIDEYATKYNYVSPSLAFGVLNFPFKFRNTEGNTDFSGAFNFGTAIGYKFPHKSSDKFTWSILTGYSISNVVLDSVSTSKNQDDLTSTNNFTAFSFSIGLMLEYEKIQAGLFLGWDYLNRINQDQYDWKYQGKPWISVGFGYSIFSNEKSGTVNKEKQ